MNRPEGDNPAEADEAPPRVALDKAPPGGDGAPDEPPPPPPPAARPPRRRLRRAVVGLVVVLVAALIAAAFVRVPYYRFSPGSLYATEALVRVDGAPTFPDDAGQVDFTTVSSKKASILDYFFARFDEAVELRPAEEIEQGHTPEENRQENLEMMVSSKQMAEVAALRKLGYRIDMHGTGALVKALYKDPDGKDLPAAAVLRVNDTITAVDGQPVHLGEEAVSAIGTHKPGDTITLQVEAAPGQGRTETVTLVSRCAAVRPGECPEGDADKPLLGVRLSNRDTRFDVPLDLDIDTKDVGGPSAGLAITLGIIDVLTPGSLTGGSHVATTGTIDADGNVGEVGGIRQKTHLVIRQGVGLFLVPAGEEFEEARRYAEGSGTRVVPVRTLDEALTVLRDHGGRTEVVAEEAAARSGTSAPPGTAN